MTQYYHFFILKVVPKPHLRPNGCVVPRIEMLTYLRIRSASNTRDALPLNLIWGFEATFRLISDGSQTTKLISSSMTKIVDLHHYRTQMVEQRAFGPWRKRFGETYDANTRLSDLSDKTLFFLAQPGEESSMAYYEIIMGVLDLGPATKFNYLASEQQMRVVDIHLFLADQMRFEMMRRLKWLDALYCQNNSFVEMVQDFERIKTSCSEKPPELAPFHPGQATYRKLAARDKEVFIRQLLREALEEFEKQIKT